eukprot:3476217-Rhodomonas_salina.1
MTTVFRTLVQTTGAEGSRQYVPSASAAPPKRLIFPGPRKKQSQFLKSTETGVEIEDTRIAQKNRAKNLNCACTLELIVSACGAVSDHCKRCTEPLKQPFIRITENFCRTDFLVTSPHPEASERLWPVCRPVGHGAVTALVRMPKSRKFPNDRIPLFDNGAAGLEATEVPPNPRSEGGREDGWTTVYTSEDTLVAEETRGLGDVELEVLNREGAHRRHGDGASQCDKRQQSDGLDGGAAMFCFLSLSREYSWAWLCTPRLPCAKPSAPPPFFYLHTPVSWALAAVMGLQHALAMMGGLSLAPPTNLLLYGNPAPRTVALNHGTLSCFFSRILMLQTDRSSLPHRSVAHVSSSSLIRSSSSSGRYCDDPHPGFWAGLPASQHRRRALHDLCWPHRLRPHLLHPGSRPPQRLCTCCCRAALLSRMLFFRSL